MKKFKEENLKEIINKQFLLNGYNNITFEDIEGIEDWYLKYVTTEEIEEIFREWLKVYLKPYSLGRLDKEIGWLILGYGLKTVSKEEKKENDKNVDKKYIL